MSDLILIMWILAILPTPATRVPSAPDYHGDLWAMTATHYRWPTPPAGEPTPMLPRRASLRCRPPKASSYAGRSSGCSHGSPVGWRGIPPQGCTSPRSNRRTLLRSFPHCSRSQKPSPFRHGCKGGRLKL